MISTLAVLKSKMEDKPWLYEEEEHTVLELAGDAVKFIQGMKDGDSCDIVGWLEVHK